MDVPAQHLFRGGVHFRSTNECEYLNRLCIADHSICIMLHLHSSFTNECALRMEDYWYDYLLKRAYNLLLMVILLKEELCELVLIFS